MYMLFIVNHDDSTDLYVVVFLNGTSDHLQRGFLWKAIRVKNERRKVFILSCSLRKQFKCQKVDVLRLEPPVHVTASTECCAGETGFT